MNRIFLASTIQKGTKRMAHLDICRCDKSRKHQDPASESHEHHGQIFDVLVASETSVIISGMWVSHTQFPRTTLCTVHYSTVLFCTVYAVIFGYTVCCTPTVDCVLYDMICW